MRVLPSFTKACIALAMYTATFDFDVPVCYLTCLLKSCWLMFLYISAFLFKVMVWLAWLTRVGSKISIVLLSSNLSLSMDCILHAKTVPKKYIKTLKRSNALSKLKEQAWTYKHQTTKKFKSSHFQWNKSHKFSHSIELNQCFVF
jgi:hypothetical protein